MSTGANDLDAKMMSAFEGNFIDATDIGAEPKEVTISGVVPKNEVRDASKKLINKPIIAFEKTSKRMIMNKVNWSILRMLHGKKASAWIGKKIILCVRYIDTTTPPKHKNLPVVRIQSPVENMTFATRKWYGTEQPVSHQ